MRYTNEEMQQMAQAFLGMLNANVDVRPRAVMMLLSQIFNISDQEVWQRINDMANGEYSE